MGAESVVEHLLEAHGDRKLVGLRAWPEGRLPGRSRGDGEEVAACQLAAKHQLVEREAAVVVLLVEQWQASEIRRRVDRSGIDLLLGEQGAIGGNLLCDRAEETERFMQSVAGLPGPQQCIQRSFQKATRLRVRRLCQDVVHRKALHRAQRSTVGPSRRPNLRSAMAGKSDFAGSGLSAAAGFSIGWPAPSSGGA